MKRALFLIIGLFILPSSGKGDDFTLSGYTEVGKRSTAEDYEEEDTDDDYTYQNYHIKFEQRLSDRLRYDVNSFIYNKDYRSRDSLDNISRIFKTNWSYYIRKLKPEGSGLASDRPEGHGLASYSQSHSQSHKDGSVELEVKLKYKEKRYNNTPINEYDELKVAPSLTIKKNDLYAIDLALGMDNFDYLAEGQKDQLKLFTKLGAQRYLLGEDLRLISSYRIENSEQEKIDRKRTKQEALAGFDYSLDLSWIYKLSIRGEWGQRDTKEEEERDEDFDYEYWRYYTKAEHNINPKLKTDLRYQYFNKDYISADLDHRGFYIQNGWDYKILDDERQRLELGFEFGHKDVEYNLKAGNNYQKEVFGIKTNYQRKKDYKAKIGVEANFYDFDDQGLPAGQGGNDKKRYYALLGVEKLFLKGDLALSLDFKYRYTNYDQKENKEEEGVRLAFKYKF